MNNLHSHVLANDYAYDGITNINQLKEEQLIDFSIQLYEEEKDVGDQISMLIGSDTFNVVPELLIALVRPQDPHPINEIRSSTINSLIKDNIREKISNYLIKCVINTYTPMMNHLLEEARIELASELDNDRLNYQEAPNERVVA